MSQPQLPAQEAARLDALYQYEILDTLPEAVFDNPVRLAAHVCRTPIALINFIDRNRQWFKASIGWMFAELPRHVGFCSHTILQPELLIVPDACQDIRFADNPLVTCEPYIRFYAGVPLITPDGQAIGTLCVMDQRSRVLDQKQTRVLKILARQVVNYLESRRQLTRAHRVKQKIAVDALAETEERFRCLVQNSSDIISVLEADGTICYVSPAVERILGYKTADLVGKNAIAYVHPEDVPTYQASLAKTLQQPGVVVFSPFRVRHADGAWIFMETSSNNQLDNASVKGLVLNVRDITERRRVEEELRSSEERFRQLAENLHQVFWMSTVDMKQILYISPAYEEIVQRTCASLYEQPDSWLDTIHPEDRECVLAAVEKQLRVENSYDVEYRSVRRDGSVRWLWARLFPVRNQQGAIYRFAGIAEDITERKQAEQQIQASLKEKEVLLQEIHHRVKNNLQVICSLLNLQSGYIKDRQALESFKESQSRIKSIALLHEKLYQSKNLSQINFAEYVQQLAVNLFRAYGVNSSAISLKIHVEDVFLDVNTAIPCGLIINELVSNCIKHAFPAGTSGEIWILLLRVPNHNNKLILSVRDNGVGFPKHIDFRLSESLGLQLVNTLVAQLKGNVEFNCNGTTEFKINFIVEKTSN